MRKDWLKEEGKSLHNIETSFDTFATLQRNYKYEKNPYKQIYNSSATSTTKYIS